MSHYPFMEGHPLQSSHELLRKTFVEQGDIGKELVPVMLGMNPPCKTSEEYAMFILAYFKPFSPKVPLLRENVAIDFLQFKPSLEHL